MTRTWLLLFYNISPEPTSRRVYIWRKLKRLGAILLHDAVWVVPNTPRTREHFQWLTAEMIEMEGEAWLWESQPAHSGPETTLIQQFVQQTETAYRAILDSLNKQGVVIALSTRCSAGVVGLIAATTLTLSRAALPDWPALVVFVLALSLLYRWTAKAAVAGVMLGAGLLGLSLHRRF